MVCVFFSTWLMTSCIDCSRMPRACSGLQESNKNTLLSCLSEAGIGSANRRKQIKEETVVYHVMATWRIIFLFTDFICVFVCVNKSVCCAHTWWAGVELQTRLSGLQQPLYEATGEKRRGEDDRPLSLNLHRLHYTVRDQVLLVTWGDRHKWR